MKVDGSERVVVWVTVTVGSALLRKTSHKETTSDGALLMIECQSDIESGGFAIVIP